MIRKLSKKEFTERHPEVSTYGLEHASPVYLENGTVLTDGEWNGEDYTVKTSTGEETYRPIQKQIKGMDQWETIGYEQD